MDAAPIGRPIALRLGARTYDLTNRALVMGILNRTSDSFFAPAATMALEDLLVRAAQLVRDGADLLDVGGVKAGPGPAVGEDEELERVVPAVTALRARFDVPLSVDTWRASVARACFEEGAVLGNDISGFSDPDYLAAAAQAGAAVVATHIRLAPRVADPTPHYNDVTSDVATFLLDCRSRAMGAGVAPDQIVLDAGLDLGKTPAHSVQLLRDSARLASLGTPLLLSASNKPFLGAFFQLDVADRRDASAAATSLGVCAGCRVLRVHDVLGTVRVRDTLEAVMAAR